MRHKVEAMIRREFPIMYRSLGLLKQLRLRKVSSELARLLNDRIEDNIDPVTGLVQRRFFMKALMREVTEKMPGFENSGTLPDSVIRVTVLFGDFAFLNYFNSLSYSMGDQALARTGQILGDKFSTSLVCRQGGDEFAILSTDSLGDVLERKEVAQRLITAVPYHQLDLEYATMADVRDLLALFPLPSERRVKFVVNALTDIAMARAQIAKYYERLGLLIKLYLARNGLYEELVTYARKGAGNINDEEVAAFAKQVEAGDDVSLDCLAYALNAKGTAAKGSPYEEAVVKIAEKIFITSL